MRSNGEDIELESPIPGGAEQNIAAVSTDVLCCACEYRYFYTARCNLRKTRETNPVMMQADIFSFAIVLWELCALKKPFAGMSAHQHSRKVNYFFFAPDSLQSVIVAGNHPPYPTFECSCTLRFVFQPYFPMTDQFRTIAVCDLDKSPHVIV